MRLEEELESYSRISSEFPEKVENILASARSRLVWFVAIAGFTILNGKNFWDPIADGEFTGVALALLALPWAIAAFLAVITHFVIDEVVVKDTLFYTKKRAVIDCHLRNLKQGDADHADPMEIRKIINSTHPDLVEPKKNLDKWACAARWLERIAFIVLGLCFLWAIIGPFVLSDCAN